MPFDRETRHGILRDRAEAYLRVALDGIDREYPRFSAFVATEPGSYVAERIRHPAFFGCFDWHSSVGMHGAVVRLLRRFPDTPSAATARGLLHATLTPTNLLAERRSFADPAQATFERPYGWTWLLTLADDLATWDDPDGAQWAAAAAPLADLFAERLAAWLPNLSYPQRTGMHPNSANALARGWAFAERRAAGGDPVLLQAIRTAALRWFADDANYPVAYEPCGTDFLSPALTEAALMALVLDSRAFPAWLDRFLPTLGETGVDAPFSPVAVTDEADPMLGHLHGLNLSRARDMVAIAAALPSGDPRSASLLAAAERHAAASLSKVAGTNYGLEHWLAAYAVMLLD